MTTVELDLRRVYAAYPTGVAAVAAVVDGRPAGIAASSFVPVSLEPPLVSVCVARTSTTWPRLRHRARLGISVLADEHEAIVRQLGGRAGDRFAGVAWRATEEGAVLLDGAAAWFECSVDQVVRAGDHDIVVLAVHELDAVPRIGPLVFHASTYRRLA